ncbi:unnamed protein product [Schistocephalus solidus]|uniref:Secreted protein n=1 Tax=Schistocephalus solidus TaxID=70667 RepID=A0A183TMM6_SCHSO|nr:unnamed protein product [Schistocephalus solidus]
MAVIALFTYSRFLGGGLAKESEVATLTYERPQSRASHVSGTGGVASQPPCGQLLSSGSCRRGHLRSASERINDPVAPPAPRG